MKLQSFMSEHWFNVIAGLIAIIITITFCALVVLERSIPDAFAPIASGVILYFFGFQAQRPGTIDRKDISATVQAVREAERVPPSSNNSSMG